MQGALGLEFIALIVISVVTTGWGWIAWEFALRIIGGIGYVLLAMEVIRIFHLMDHPRMRRIMWKLAIFFGVVGLLKFTTTGLDWYFTSLLSGMVLSNVLVYWLYFFARKRRLRIKETAEDTSSRERLQSYFLAIMDEMRIAKKDIDHAVARIDTVMP